MAVVGSAPHAGTTGDFAAAADPVKFPLLHLSSSSRLLLPFSPILPLLRRWIDEISTRRLALSRFFPSCLHLVFSHRPIPSSLLSSPVCHQQNCLGRSRWRSATRGDSDNLIVFCSAASIAFLLSDRFCIFSVLGALCIDRVRQFLHPEQR